MKRNISNIDWNLAGRILSGEANVQEKTEFNSWIEKEDNKKEWSNFNNQLNDIDHAMVSESVDVDKAWANVSNKTNTKLNIGKKKMLYIGTSIAASIVISLLVFSNLLFDSPVQNEMAQTSNQIINIVMQDGSQIDLNRNSQFSYPAEFDENERNVKLQGEAYFSIEKDSDRPFTIQTSNIKIKVLGTSFNVKAYPDSQINEVTVHSGVVEVSSINNQGKSLVLYAGDKATYHVKNRTITQEKIDNNNYIAWKTKEITFKNQTIGDAINLLEEVYNVSISTPEGFDDSMLYTATFDKNEIKDILQTINNTFSTNITYQNN